MWHAGWCRATVQVKFFLSRRSALEFILWVRGNQKNHSTRLARGRLLGHIHHSQVPNVYRRNTRKDVRVAQTKNGPYSTAIQGWRRKIVQEGAGHVQTIWPGLDVFESQDIPRLCDGNELLLAQWSSHDPSVLDNACRLLGRASMANLSSSFLTLLPIPCIATLLHSSCGYCRPRVLWSTKMEIHRFLLPCLHSILTQRRKKVAFWKQKKAEVYPVLLEHW